VLDVEVPIVEVKALEILFLERLLGVLHERVAEAIEAPRRHPDAGGMRVPPKAFERRGRGREPIVEVIARDAAPRAASPLADDDRRLAVALHEAARDDANHARMPGVVAHDEDARPPKEIGAVDLLDGLLRDAL